MSAGATTLRLDLDIFTGSPITSGWPVAVSSARRVVALARRSAPCSGLEPIAVLPPIGLVSDHALGEEAGERLVHGQEAFVTQGPGDETRVEQMQHRVFDASDVLVHRQPAVGRRADRRLRVRIGEAGEIPGRIDEGVEGIGFSRPGRAAAGQGKQRASRSDAGPGDCPAG